MGCKAKRHYESLVTRRVKMVRCLKAIDLLKANFQAYFGNSLVIIDEICIVVTVTMDELQTMDEDLREHTAHAMKIEVAPWIKDYVVDMDKLYTELTLEKIDNMPIGEEAKMLNHYTDLFKKCEPVVKPLQSGSPSGEPAAKKHKRDDICDLPLDLSLGKCDKILMKGDPGMVRQRNVRK